VLAVTGFPGADFVLIADFPGVSSVSTHDWNQEQLESAGYISIAPGPDFNSGPGLQQQAK
jgi:hypothetical protein